MDLVLIKTSRPAPMERCVPNEVLWTMRTDSQVDMHDEAAADQSRRSCKASKSGQSGLGACAYGPFDWSEVVNHCDTKQQVLRSRTQQTKGSREDRNIPPNQALRLGQKSPGHFRSLDTATLQIRDEILQYDLHLTSSKSFTTFTFRNTTSDLSRRLGSLRILLSGLHPRATPILEVHYPGSFDPVTAMSADLSAGQSNGRSAGLTLNLSSNNPFRNRAASPNSGLSPGSGSFSPPPPHSPFDDPEPARPVSRNPFFDPTDNSQAQRLQSPASMASANENRKSPTAEELFDNLIIIDDDDKPLPKPAPRPDGARVPPRGPPGGPPRGENVPRGGRGPPPSHRPTRSQEEALRARRMQERAGSNGARDLLGMSQKRPAERRPRRNSESSIMAERPPLTEEEKKAKELRRRERERRHREGKDRSKSGKPSRKLDLIDQLDATSIYGTGLFHHDGPFDALNPHRNRNGSRHAPMQAFPKDSINMSLGGSGPLNAKPDHKALMGKHDEEAYLDYNRSRKGEPAIYEEPAGTKKDANVFDPHARASILHGDETLGLGTSTFLEGTPVAQTAIQRRQAESAQETMEQGLQRKKSLAQRIRGINRGPRDMNNRSRITNPDGAYGPRSGDLPTGSSTGERNPFFNDYDKGEERITVRRQDSNAMSPGSPNSPPRGYGLERRATTDASAAMSQEPTKPQASGSGGGGFLTRVKSLKGGRRQRPEPPSVAAPTYTPPSAPAPGAAI
ncbi:mucin-1 [Seiridium cupressi]